MAEASGAVHPLSRGHVLCFLQREWGGPQVFRSKSIQGPWERNQLPGRHDLSVLFDDDGKIYIISGNGSPYPIEELAPDLKSFVPDASPTSPRAAMGEGHHLYKIKGKYLIFPQCPVEQRTRWLPSPIP